MAAALRIALRVIGILKIVTPQGEGKSRRLWLWIVLALAPVIVPIGLALMGSMAALMVLTGTTSLTTGQGGPTSFSCPVANPTITQRFQPTPDNLLEPSFTYQGVFYPHFHTGLDMAVNEGTPIVAATTGIVEFSGTQTDNLGRIVGYGQYVKILDGNNQEELYGHMSVLIATYHQPVTAGTIIGLVGSTGASTGPHVHFEWRVQGVPQDPAGFLPVGCK